MKKLIILISAITLTGCALSKTKCGMAVNDIYSHNNVWIKQVDRYEMLVLTSDSILLKIETKGLKYPYVSKVDTLGRVAQ